MIILSCNIEPYGGDITEDSIDTLPTTCEEAATNTSNAALNFANAATSDSNYHELCSAYKNALQNQLTICGDQTGTFQSLIDALGDCEGDDGTGGNTNSVHAFMTANIDGTQYNDMKPNGYLFFPGGVTVNDYFSRSDDDYILIQGNNNYKNPSSTGSAVTREINLRLPSINWKEGTFALYDEYNDVFEGVCFYTFIRFDYPENIEKKDLVGEIIVSKFSLEERIIQGTFEFKYMLIDKNDNSESGPFNVTGTFDYTLDDEFFN